MTIARILYAWGVDVLATLVFVANLVLLNQLRHSNAEAALNRERNTLLFLRREEQDVVVAEDPYVWPT